MKRYFSFYENVEQKQADVYIYGDITSWPWLESDTSSYTLSKQLQELGDDVENVNVYINSYGGEVGEGLAIYNALKRHPAKVTTYADGFACSIASVIFAAGDERIISDTSLLMIHNAWTSAAGNSEELRKAAEDLDTITSASINAYMGIVNIEEDEVRRLMNEETWITGEEALEMGFANKLETTEKQSVASQSVKNIIYDKLQDEGKRNTIPQKQELDMSNLKEAEGIAANIVEKLEKADELIDKQEDKDIDSIEESESKPILMKDLFKNKGE